MYDNDTNDDPIVVASKPHHVFPRNGRDRSPVSARYVYRVLQLAKRFGMCVEQLGDLSLYVATDPSRRAQEYLVFDPIYEREKIEYKPGDTVRVVAQEGIGVVQGQSDTQVAVEFANGKTGWFWEEIVHFAVE